MQVNNLLAEESFRYTQEKPDYTCRLEEVENLADIAEYCASETVNEKIQYRDDKLWQVEVKKGLQLQEWLFAESEENAGNEDVRRLLLNILSEQCNPDGAAVVQPENLIFISLGEFEQAAADRTDYLRMRRDILKTCRTAEEYDQFMRSCFPDSEFAENIVSEMEHIKNFSEHTAEITDCLGILNDEAVDLYVKYQNNLKEAMRILSAKCLECAPDPRNKEKLNFRFKYMEQLDGQNVVRTKVINCHSHLKLAQRNSNLRIYFSWGDPKVGAGEKVLIGRIGKHPY